MHLIFFISYWLCSKNVFQEVWVQITTQKYPIPVISVWLLRHFWLQYHIGLSRGLAPSSLFCMQIFSPRPTLIPATLRLCLKPTHPLSSLLLSVCCCWVFFSPLLLLFAQLFKLFRRKMHIYSTQINGFRRGWCCVQPVLRSACHLDPCQLGKVINNTITTHSCTCKCI